MRRHGKYIRSGIIDAAMPDASVLWLAADGADERQMFEAALGYQVWIYPWVQNGEPEHSEFDVRTRPPAPGAGTLLLSVQRLPG